MKLAPDELELLKKRESLPTFKFNLTETDAVITQQILSDIGKLGEYKHTLNKDTAVKFSKDVKTFNATLKINHNTVSIHPQFDSGVECSYLSYSFRSSKAPLPLSERIYDFMQKLSKYKLLNKIVKYYNRRISDQRNLERKADIEYTTNTIKTLTNGDNNICKERIGEYGMRRGTYIDLTDLKSSDMMIVYDYDTDEPVELSVEDLISTFGDISIPTAVKNQDKLYIGTMIAPDFYPNFIIKETDK